MKPTIVIPFSETDFKDIYDHTKEVRRLFDWPGIPLHDRDQGPEHKMNRWFWHNPPLLREYHRKLQPLASQVFGEPVWPSYVFLSMYNEEGVVPLHTDRPPCKFTIDLLIHSNHNEKPWPIYVNDEVNILEPGQALAYSGTDHPHYRKPMKEDSDATKATLGFFHFVPIGFQGELN